MMGFPLGFPFKLPKKAVRTDQQGSQVGTRNSLVHRCPFGEIDGPGCLNQVYHGTHVSTELTKKGDLCSSWGDCSPTILEGFPIKTHSQTSF